MSDKTRSADWIHFSTAMYVKHIDLPGWLVSIVPESLAILPDSEIPTMPLHSQGAILLLYFGRVSKPNVQLSHESLGRKALLLRKRQPHPGGKKGNCINIG